MLTKKKKIGKKQLKEDKLVTFYSKSLQYYDVYKNQIIIGAVILAIIIAAIFYFSDISQKNSVQASAELAKTVELFEAGNYQGAIDGNPGNDIAGFKSIVDNYGGTEPGQVAKIYLGHCYFYLGDYDKALEYYSDYSGSNDLYEAAGLAGEAACYEAKGDYEQAASLFRDAAYVYENNAGNPQYLLNAGIDFIKIKQYESAKEVLTKIIEDYPSAQEKREADKYLAEAELKL